MPGLALAYEILRRGDELIFFSGKRPIERHILKDRPFKVYELPVEGLVGRPLKDQIRASLKLIGAISRAYKVLREFRPRVILAEGGYVSVPVVLAGKLLRIKTSLQEQNVVPGKANRLLSRIVDRVFISFPESRDYFPEGKVLFSGTPVRRELLEPRERIHQGRGLLVLGGSLGAKFLNDLTLRLVPQLFSEVKDLMLFHQTGLEDFERVKGEYERLPHWEALQERIRIFPFIEDMGFAYAQADLVLGRAGASTIAELIALKKPAIFIPFPYATDRHQDKNAEALVKVGCALKFNQRDLDPALLLETLKKLLLDETLLNTMAKAYDRIKINHPEEVILNEMKRLAGG